MKPTHILLTALLLTALLCAAPVAADAVTHNGKTYTTYDQIYAEWQLLGTSAGDYRADGILARVLNARMQQGK